MSFFSSCNLLDLEVLLLRGSETHASPAAALEGAREAGGAGRGGAGRGWARTGGKGRGVEGSGEGAGVRGGSTLKVKRTG